MDDTLAEIFLEEIPPTGKQLIVCVLKILGLVYGLMDLAVYSTDFLSLYVTLNYMSILSGSCSWIYMRTDAQIISPSTTFCFFNI